MHFDVVTLSRLQFALTIMFHYLFPPLTIGLSVLMVIIEALWIKTRDVQYKAMALFWTKLFGVTFAVGVATGLVMEFQFGTNWATYSRFVGDVFGSALAAEGIFAFFLESGFLAIVVFGWNRVTAKMHFFATCMVSLGSIFSSVWIVIANSWQQTPAGYHLVRTASGLMRAEVTNFWAMIFNPSTLPRLLHVWVGAFILGAFYAMSICAWYILKGKHLKFAKKCFVIALIYGSVVSFGGLLSGHLQACEVAENQPAKLAALEANFHTGTSGTQMYIIGVPNIKEERVDLGLSIPKMLSMLVYFNPNKPVPGLDSFPKEDRPPVVVPFTAYHIMVGSGMLFIAMSILGLFFWKRGTLFEQRWLMWGYVFTVLAAFAANECGWTSAEVGRQPWVVYGLLRTHDAVSHSARAPEVMASILMFAFTYTLLFIVWVTVLNDKIQAGPEELEAIDEAQIGPRQPGESFWKSAARTMKREFFALTARSQSSEPGGTPATPTEGKDS
jgi:cytochrome d ubiquinol oxidase subunit I